MKNIGKNLQKLRKLNGYTQQEIASLIGISKSAYCKIETEQSKLSLETAVRLSEIFNVSLDYLTNMQVNSSNFFLMDKSSTNILNYLMTEWNGDFNSMIQLLGTYASMPVCMRKDVAEHDIVMFVNGIEDCDEELIKFINIPKCKEIVNKLK